MKVILPIFVLVTLACLLVDAKQKRSVAAVATVSDSNELSSVEGAPKVKRSASLSRSKRSDDSDDSDDDKRRRRRPVVIQERVEVIDRPVRVEPRYPPYYRRGFRGRGFY